MTSFTHPLPLAPAQQLGPCHLFILLFVECFIEDECLERGQGQNGGAEVIGKWQSQGLLSKPGLPREKVAG